MNKNLITTYLIEGRDPWACGVAWYPCSFGSYRLEFKSQQAHQSQYEENFNKGFY